jgi:methionyl-tRNA formyltransferase
MRLAVAATPDVALPALDWILQSDHELALLFTQPDRPAGRGRKMRESEVSAWGNLHGVPVIKPRSAEPLSPHLADVDLVVTIAFGILIPEPLLKVPRHGFLNVHFSRLPHLRGAAPVQRAILQGDSEIGISIFQLEKGMDTGPVYVCEDFAIDSDESSGELLRRLATHVPPLLDQALKMLIAGQLPKAQEGSISLAPKISKEEARIEWESESNTIRNLIRAFTPQPGAWTMWRGGKFHISGANISSERLSPGEIRVTQNQIFVGTGTEALSLTFVTPFGKGAMGAADWARGARLSEGDRFE